MELKEKWFAVFGNSSPEWDDPIADVNKIVENIRIFKKETESQKTLGELIIQSGIHPYYLKTLKLDGLGGGINMWQYPNQFAPYLMYLKDKNISSYLEIGVEFGGSFIFTIEYLSKFTSIHSATAIDIRPQSEILKEYSKMRPFEYIQSDSNALENGNYDLVFIDADHLYKSVKKDFENIKNKAKYIAFHDICSCGGIIEFWREMKKNYSNCQFMEFTNNYPNLSKNYGGIGLVKMM